MEENKNNRPPSQNPQPQPAADELRVLCHKQPRRRLKEVIGSRASSTCEASATNCLLPSFRLGSDSGGKLKSISPFVGVIWVYGFMGEFLCCFAFV